MNIIEENRRPAGQEIDPVFLKRWSPRAFTDEPIEESELLSILTAGSWAPSAFNLQPWRFLFARRGTADWDTYVSLLVEFNAVWAARAAALVFLVSDTQQKDPNGIWNDSTTHSFDAGAAWGFLALQASMKGLQAHAMAGIYHQKIYEVLQLPRFYRVEVAIAIGKQGDPTILPEKLRAREYRSTRRPLREIAFQGIFQSSKVDLQRSDALKMNDDTTRKGKHS